MAEPRQVPAGTAGVRGSSGADGDAPPGSDGRIPQATGALPSPRTVLSWREPPRPRPCPLPGSSAHPAAGVRVLGRGPHHTARYLSEGPRQLQRPLGQPQSLQKLPHCTTGHRAWLGDGAGRPCGASAQSGLLLIPSVATDPRRALPNKCPTHSSPGQRVRPTEPSGQHALPGWAAPAQREV